YCLKNSFCHSGIEGVGKTVNIFTGCGDGEVLIHWCSQPQTSCRTVLPPAPLDRGDFVVSAQSNDKRGV
ncbi:MAG TPA: hypothetical protein VI727_01035, partial [Candidatus Brocadiaceae bacterium]|nr:hypothetical protein [Candidatus Brocadiaceae bacterium]